ncbi:ancient ubiquitous 1 [Pelobates cultripes]|uniref:Lipid droplet-regulating VLDL assembly factor AUP1 n=1 Tax=Pelobates cultripes TaxID=61616 RepID=A0AAD1SGQ5_PELCU|nr:ancient ubiquitous 1 [Pelobates cultripes]
MSELSQSLCNILTGLSARYRTGLCIPVSDHVMSELSQSLCNLLTGLSARYQTGLYIPVSDHVMSELSQSLCNILTDLSARYQTGLCIPVSDHVISELSQSLCNILTGLSARYRTGLCIPVSDHVMSELSQSLCNILIGLSARWLPPVFRYPKESDEEFSSRVQKLMALSMGIIGTRHTAVDRAEHLKRRRRESPPPAASVSSSTADSRMVQRVKEVLPQVPLSVIHKDLARTKCVDTTITNLLEGRVPFVSEEESCGRSEASVMSNLPTKKDPT